MNPYLLKRPLITERTLQLANEANIYTFEVDRLANKEQIKAAIEQLYKVNVQKVNTQRSYRVRKTTGRKRLPVLAAPTKKAMVTLKKGQSIEVFNIGGAQ